MYKPHFEKKDGQRLLHILLTVAVVAAVLAANLALTAFGQASNLFLDTTVEGRYTLRTRAVEILRAADMQDDVDIIFCTDPDKLLGSTDASLVYIMALELEKQLPNIHVSTVNAMREPEKVEPYLRTSASSITANHVIVTSGTEFRTYTVKSFFTSDSESGNIIGFNGEQKMCEAILSLTARDLPLACFTVGNGETLPRQNDEKSGYLYDLVRSAGFEIVGIDLETEDIPKECALLIINGPNTDFSSGRLSDIDYNSPLTKIDRFLDGYGTVFYFRDPEAGKLKNLEEFLAEWGVSFDVKDSVGTSFSGTTLIDSTNALSGDSNRICGIYGESSIYSDITKLSSPPKAVFENCSPVRILWRDNASSVNNSGRTVEVLFSTSATAQAVDGEGNTVTAGAFPLMTHTHETRVVDNVYFTANLFVCGTDLYHTADYLADNVYANGDVLASAIRGAARTTVSTAEELEFKYYESKGFTESEDATENTIYQTDADGNMIWVTDADGASHRVVVRVIRPITAGELTAWTVVLTLIPLALLGGLCTFVYLRRRSR